MLMTDGYGAVLMIDGHGAVLKIDDGAVLMMAMVLC